MGLVLDEESNVMLSTTLDVGVIMVLGGVMLFLMSVVRGSRRSVILYLAGYLTILMGYLMYHAQKASSEKRRWSVHEYEWITFFAMYTIALFWLMGVLQWTSYY
jgi:cytochrome c biogenesis protein CcdA